MDARVVSSSTLVPPLPESITSVVTVPITSPADAPCRFASVASRPLAASGDTGELRMPMTPLSKDEELKLRTTLTNYGLL